MQCKRENKKLDLLAEEIMKGHTLSICLNVSFALDDLLEHREENIKILYEVAAELDKHSRKSSIAKLVGSAVGAPGKAIVGVGAAALLGAPFTGLISGAVGGAMCAVGGTIAALGTLTSTLTYATEYRLCKKELNKANKFIKVDKVNVEKYTKHVDDLNAICSQYGNDNTSAVLEIVLSIFTQFKDHVRSEGVDFKSIAKKLGVKEKDLPSKMSEYIKKVNTSGVALASTGIKTLSSNVALFIAGGGASFLLLDVFVLYNSTYNLATNTGHPAADELRDHAKNLEKETKRLKEFSKVFAQKIEGSADINDVGYQHQYVNDDETDLVSSDEDEYESAVESLD